MMLTTAEDTTTSSVELETRSTQTLGIIPTQFIQTNSRAARLWIYARSIDHPLNGGTGSGLISFDICDLIAGLNRSLRSCYRYLRAAKDKGFLHWYRVEGETVTLKYCSLERVAHRLGLKQIGAIAVFPLSELEHAKAIAAEAEAEALQSQSYYCMRSEWGRFAKGQPKPHELLIESPTSAKLAGVMVTMGKRLMYLAPHWRPFGGSQKTIAERLGVSVRTVQYRLDHSWREHRKMNPIKKIQTARQIHEDLDLALVKAIYHFTEDAPAKWIRLGRRLFQRGTNLYKTQCELRSYRCRKALFKDAVSASGEATATDGEIERLNSQGARLKRRPDWERHRNQ